MPLIRNDDILSLTDLGTMIFASPQVLLILSLLGVSVLYARVIAGLFRGKGKSIISAFPARPLSNPTFLLTA